MWHVGHACGMSAQRASLFPWISEGESVRQFMSREGPTGEKVWEISALTPYNNEQNEAPGSLMGGERVKADMKFQTTFKAM